MSQLRQQRRHIARELRKQRKIKEVDYLRWLLVEERRGQSLFAIACEHGLSDTTLYRAYQSVSDAINRELPERTEQAQERQDIPPETIMLTDGRELYEAVDRTATPVCRKLWVEEAEAETTEAR